MGKSSAASPSNWPANLPYLSQPSYASHLSKPQIAALGNRPTDLTAEVPSNLPRGPSSLVKITPITVPAHPANGQSGLFAASTLAPGSLILPYYGIVHSACLPHSLEHEKSDYDLWLDRDGDLAVDADKAGNEARFVNDYRGVRERPNAEFRECWDPRIGQKCMGVFVLPAGKNAARKKGKRDGGIAKGEEICISYGKGFWGKRQAEEQSQESSTG